MSRKSQLTKRRTPESKQSDEGTERVIEVVEQRLKEHSGPIPSGEAMEHYGKVDPSFPERIFAMAESNLRHQQEMDKESLKLKREAIKTQDEFAKRHHKYFGRGQVFGFTLALLGLVGGVVVAVTSSPQYGAAIVGAVMLLLGGAFAWGKWQESKDD